MITILGPTACGKTSLAVYLAHKLGSGVISADSRQVYRGMDLGTGKDLSEYAVDGVQVPYHLIDVLEPDGEFNLFTFLEMFRTVWKSYQQTEKTPVLCGGTGLYIEAILTGYNLVDVPENQSLRNELREKSLAELVLLLRSYGPLHATTDSTDRERAIRAIEVADFRRLHGLPDRTMPYPCSGIFGITFDRDTVRARITQRLRSRLADGMIDEVKRLMDQGITKQRLLAFGLEYKYITLYLCGELSFDEMFNKLNISIHQFSKRQMTWFRKMERSGIAIQWIDGRLTLDEKFNYIANRLNII